MAAKMHMDTSSTYREVMKHITTWLVVTAKRCDHDLSFLDHTEAASINARTAVCGRNGSCGHVVKYSSRYGNQITTTDAIKSVDCPQIFTKHGEKDIAAETNPQCKVPISQLTSLTKSIAASITPKISVPPSIYRAIESVIKLREAVYEKLVSMSVSETPHLSREAIAGYHRLVVTLRVVLVLLKAPKQSDTLTTAPEDDLFEALATLEIDEDASTSEFDAGVSYVPEWCTEERGNGEVAKAESIFAMCCLFEDMNNVRKHLKQVWFDYLMGRLDIMSAAVTTDTAFALLKESCEEVQDAIGERANYVAMFNYLKAIVGEERLTTDMFKDWVCEDTAAILNDCFRRLKPKQARIAHRVNTYAFPKEKYTNGLNMLQGLLPELVKLFHSKIYLPVEDLLTIGLRSTMGTNDVDKIPCYAIFALQILLDIHDILDDNVVRPFDQLQETAKRVVATLDNYLSYCERNPLVAEPFMIRGTFNDIRRFANDWILTDVMANMNSRGSKKVVASPYHMLKNHPILCGLLIFRLNLMMNESGIQLCNKLGSIIYPAYLYITAKHSAQLEEKWADMEYLISIHFAKRIFVGIAPTEPQQYLQSFFSTLGKEGSALLELLDPGEQSWSEFGWSPLGLESNSPVKEIFRNRYIHSNKTADLTTHNIIPMIFGALKAERTSAPSNDPESLRKTAHKMALQKRYTTLQGLTAVREGLASGELQLLFDYFSLHQRTWELLSDLRSQLDDHLVQSFGQKYVESKSQIPFMIGYVLESMNGSEEMEAGMGEDEGVREKVVEDAMELLRAFLRDEDNGSKGIDDARARTDAIIYG